MNKKIAAATYVICIVILFSPLSHAIDYNPPGYFDRGENGGILEAFWRTIVPFDELFSSRDPMDSADDYQWYNGTGHTLREWERTVCVQDLSTEIKTVRNTAVSTGEQVYITSYTLTAIKTAGSAANSTYYEVSWYLMPFNSDMLYRVYLSAGSSREYFVGKAGNPDDDSKFVLSRMLVGSSGYDIRYLNSDFASAIIEFKTPGSAELAGSFIVSVVK